MQIPGDTAIIIYQMGKVGSTTIHESLKNAELSIPIYKAHFLSDEGIRHGEEFHQKTLKIPWASTPHIQTSRFLRETFHNDKTIQWKVITLVRDPVSREISEFFQYLSSLYPELLDKDGNLEKKRALKILRTKFMFYNPVKNYTCRWFDVEMKGMFDVDVYEHPFDTQRGFTIIEHDNVDVLILRLEDLDHSLSRGVTEFLGLETPIEMIRSNVRADQERGVVYREVLRDFTLSESLCRKVYSSKFASHFYSQAEIEKFTQRWMGN